MFQIKVANITRSVFQFIYQLFSIWSNWDKLIILIKTSSKHWGNTGLIWTTNLPDNFLCRPSPFPNNKFHCNLLSSLWDDTWRQADIIMTPLWFHCMYTHREWTKWDENNQLLYFLIIQIYGTLSYFTSNIQFSLVPHKTSSPG
jgi:hypothetical protein